MAIELYDYQKELINNVRKVWKSHNRIMIQLATAGGKTFCIASMIDSMAKNGMRCVFLVPRITLIQQAINEFVEFGIDIRRISKIHCDYKTDYSCKIIVASTASFIRKEFMPFDLLIHDEAHIQSKKVIARMEAHPNERHIGLSATPFSKGLGKYYTALVRGVGMRELIEMEGMGLCSYTIYCPSIPKLSSIKVKNGDFVESDLEALMQGAKIAGDIVSNWCEHGENRTTMVLPVTVAHAHKIQSDFSDVGIASEVIHANTEIEERESIFKRLEDETLKIVISVGCLTEGFSIKKISCLINARPTKSKAKWIQGAGRVLRYLPGKHAIIFDHGGTALTLGLPEDIQIDELCDGKKAESVSEAQKKKEYEALPKACNRCGVLKEPKEVVCHNCGYKQVHKEDIEVARDLGLAVFAGEKKKAEPTKADKQKFWSELLGWQLAQQMNGKAVSKGRISHIYKEKFGVFPQSLEDRIMNPSSELTSFIRSKNIAYAKAREAQGNSNG